MMKKVLIALLAVLPVLVACGSAPTEEPSETTTQHEALKACPYLVPICDTTHCKLVGSCPQQCVCDNGASTQCGTQKCGKGEYCCNSTTAGYECLPTGYMCPL